MSEHGAVTGARRSRDGSARTAGLHLPAQLTSGGVARRFLQETLARWQLTTMLDDALLLTSELVNNAVVHAGSDVDLRVSSDGRRLRVEVADTGRGSILVRDASREDTGGRGLFLVEQVSHRWGTRTDEAEKAVWFEL